RIADDDAGNRAFHHGRAALGATLTSGECQQDEEAQGKLGNIRRRGVQQATDEIAEELGQLLDGTLEEAREGNQGCGGEDEDNDRPVAFELLTQRDLLAKQDEWNTKQEYIDFALPDGRLQALCPLL